MAVVQSLTIGNIFGTKINDYSDLTERFRAEIRFCGLKVVTCSLIKHQSEMPCFAAFFG